MKIRDLIETLEQFDGNSEVMLYNDISGFAERMGEEHVCAEVVVPLNYRDYVTTDSAEIYGVDPDDIRSIFSVVLRIP